MSLEIIIPEATRNLCPNPSFGLNLTHYAAVAGASLNRVLTRARFGRASCQVDTPGAVFGEGIRYTHPNTLVGGKPLTASIYARGRGQVICRLNAADNGLVWDTKPLILNDRYWQRLVVTGNIPAAEANLTISVLTYYNQATTFYVDGLQPEALGHVTTYCDGDLELELPPHDGNAYFEWVGQRHATESFRTKAFRMGGSFEDLTQGLDFDLFPIEASGLGMPPITIAQQVFSGNERAIIQSIRAMPRTIGLTMHARRQPNLAECDPKSLALLHRARQALEAVVKPDLTHKPQSFLLRYSDGNCPMDLEGVYESGLEWAGDLRQPFHNQFAMRLLAPNPYWVSDSQDAAELSVSTTIVGGHAFLVARLAGAWQGFGSANFEVHVLAVHPNGDVYAGGAFTNIGGVACRRIARWDGTQWNILAGAGNDIDNGEVYTIDFAPNGDVYLGGTFTTIDAVTYNRVARYTPGTDAFDVLNAAGTVGVGSDVNAIAVDKNGSVYLGGAFITAGGATAYRIVRYNGAVTDTFTAIGTFSGLGLDVEALEMDLDGTTLYIGGQFTDQATVPGTALPYICKYTAAAGFVEMAEFGLNNHCLALKMGVDGRLYLGGKFTTAGWWNVAKVALWNRNEFYPLGGDGDGLTGGTKVNAITVDAKGNVYFAGDFTGATGDDLCDYIALWNGTRWAHLDISVGAECLSVASKFDKLFLGYIGASVTNVAYVQTVENEGKASSYPILDVLGPLVLRYLENQDTGKVIRLNLAVLPGERVLFDLRPGYLKAVSEWRGNVMYGVMADSDFGDFGLLPGSNVIAFLGTGGNGSEEASLRWATTDWSFDDIR